jgi:hypothetical protein
MDISDMIIVFIKKYGLALFIAGFVIGAMVAYNEI